MALALRRPDHYGYGTAAPAYEPEKIRAAKKKYYRDAEKVIKTRVRERSHDGAEFSGRQIILLTVSVLALFAVLTGYVLIYSQGSRLKNDIENDRKEYYALLSENALLENSVERSIDYGAVYEYATTKLSMAVPGKQQMIFYPHSHEESVTYEEVIPK